MDKLDEMRFRSKQRRRLIEREELERILKKARFYNGMIKTEEDLFQHIERLQKCSTCKRDFYDKQCPTCFHGKVKA